MRVICLKKKNLVKMTTIIVFVLAISVFTKTFSMEHYYNVDFATRVSNSR